MRGEQMVRIFDDTVDRWAEPLRRRPLVNRLFFVLTESANHSLLWHGLNLLRTALPGRASNADVVRLGVVLGTESALINGVVKKLFRRSRPLLEVTPAHRLRRPKTTSFPSGHATSAFCAAMVLTEGSHPASKVGLFSLAGLVSYSRIHVRLHHASDVLGGAIIGLGLGWLARRVFRLLDQRSEQAKVEITQQG